jgi:hypothetical protein
MKRLLILASVVLVAGASGCRNCGRGTTAYRPCAPTPACCTPATEFSTPDVYSSPPGTTIVPAPTLSAPPSGSIQTFPGPEAYTPAQ